jgi:hypothetical protein
VKSPPSTTDHHLYVYFGREKADAPASSFKAASSLDSLKGKVSPLENDPDTNLVEEAEKKGETVSEIGKIVLTFIDRVQSDLLKYHELISVIDFLRGVMAIGALEGQVLNVAKKGGTLIEKDDLSEIYGLDEHGADEVFKQVHKINELSSAMGQLPSSILLSLVATFDSLIGDLIAAILKTEPGRIKFSDKKISYRELFTLSDLDDVLNGAIADEVNQLLRGSHEEQVEYIETLIDTKIANHYERYPNYLEIFERRNQVAHASGVATQRYLDCCSRIKFPTDDIKIGEPLNVGTKYLHKAVDYLVEFGVSTAFMAWRKLDKDSGGRPFEKMNEVGYGLIIKRRYKLAGNLLDFCLHKQKCDADEVTKRMIYVNLANSHARLGKPDIADKILKEIDWSACAPNFQVCVAAVRGDVDEVCKLLPQAVASGALNKNALRTWPVFEGIKETKEFASSFETVFEEPFQIEIVDSSADSTIESSASREQDVLRETQH